MEYILNTTISVLARSIQKGTMSFGASNVPFVSVSKPRMCPLVQLHIFSSHLNSLIKTDCSLNIEPSKERSLEVMRDDGTAFKYFVKNEDVVMKN